MKFYRHLLTAGALGALAVVPACSEEQGPSTDDGPGIEIKIAPVTYLNALDVCWGFSVHNPAGELVAQQQNICAGDYGNGAGGDIAYVIPCDASQQGDSVVTLWLEGIQTSAGAPGPATFEDEDNYINPCGLTQNYLEWDNVLGNGKEFPPADRNFDNTYCQRQIECLPNADVQVSFNLTVMRDAQQGFFDIIVDFEDIFCSAKLDTCYSNTGNQIELLFDMDAGDVDNGPRDPTAVMALACTAGPDKYDPVTGFQNITTTLHYSNIYVLCDGNIAIPLDPTGGIPAGNAGNQSTTEAFTIGGGAGPVPFTLASPVNYALYWGTEALPCGYHDAEPNNPDNQPTPISCNKKYWNIAVNVEDLEELTYTNCSLIAQATATGSDGLQLVNGELDGDGTTYAAIDYEDDILEEGDPSCDWNPLNGENSDLDESGVQTGYYSSGDIIGLPKNLMTMCYNKNSQGEGNPWYTAFKDRYTGYNTETQTMDAKELGRLGARFKGEVGGDHRKNCFKSAAAQNAAETGVWTKPSGATGAVLTTNGISEGIAAQLWQLGETGWTQIGGEMSAFQMKGYEVTFGGSQLALQLIDRRGDTSTIVKFTVDSQAKYPAPQTP